MKERYFPVEENSEIQTRVYLFFGFIITILALYLIRAYDLQINQKAYFEGLAENNRMRIVSVMPSRGIIFDRHGIALVNNIPSFNLYAVRGDMADPSAVLDRLSTFILIEDIDRIRKELLLKKEPLVLTKIKENLSLSEIAKVEGHSSDLPGIKITAELRRNAVYGKLAAHSVGYVGEVSKAQLKLERYRGFRQGDRVGQSGIEQAYDSTIRGVPGKKWVEVNVMGQELNVLREEKPVEGDDIFLTLDLKLQKVAEEALGEEAGSVVAIDPVNGEVLALVSRPAFDPNSLSEGISTRTLLPLLNDKSRPLMNRSIQGQYPPGSTFKIIMGAAILETKEADPSYSIRCNGFMQFGNRAFRDWKKEGHGSVDFRRSIVESCDVYYYQMGNRMGVDTIAKFANLFGFGKRTGFLLASEKPGLIPSTAWKKKRLKEPWYPGETLSVSIGQGYVLVTPLQMGMMISAVANDGTLYTPKMIQKVRSRRTGVNQDEPPAKATPVEISKETLGLLRSALTDVVQTPQGTAFRSKSEFVPFAGKTGTAQVVVIKKGDDRKKKLAKEINDHAWFVSYAPLEKPKIAVVVLVEHGGHGGSAAAPIAKKVIEAYLVPDAPTHPAETSPKANPVTVEG
ncbi:MAG: penicillin-binding protein 2 [Nitrospirota bacterium]